MHQPEIVVLGVGNTLMQDDGIGVQVVRALAESYRLPEGVRLIDAGVAGFAWLPMLTGVDYLLIIDAVRGDSPPGTLYRLTWDELSRRIGPTLSAHEVGVTQILGMAELIGNRPETVIIGIQPEVTDQLGLELSASLQAALPAAVEAVVSELEGRGVKIERAREATLNYTSKF